MNKGPSRMSPAGTGRMIVALAVLGILALLVWRTIDPARCSSWLGCCSRFSQYVY